MSNTIASAGKEWSLWLRQKMKFCCGFVYYYSFFKCCVFWFFLLVCKVRKKMCFSQCHGLHTMQVYCTSVRRGFQSVLCTMIVLNKKNKSVLVKNEILVLFFLLIFLTGAQYQTETTVQTFDLFMNAGLKVTYNSFQPCLCFSLMGLCERVFPQRVSIFLKSRKRC